MRLKFTEAFSLYVLREEVLLGGNSRSILRLEGRLHIINVRNHPADSSSSFPLSSLLHRRLTVKDTGQWIKYKSRYSRPRALREALTPALMYSGRWWVFQSYIATVSNGSVRLPDNLSTLEVMKSWSRGTPDSLIPWATSSSLLYT